MRAVYLGVLPGRSEDLRRMHKQASKMLALPNRFLVLGSWFSVARSSVANDAVPGACFSVSAFQLFSFSSVVDGAGAGSLFQFSSFQFFEIGEILGDRKGAMPRP